MGGEPACLVLGDNIFYGQGFTGMLRKAVADAVRGYATVFGYTVGDARRYGVVELDSEGRPVSIEENRRIRAATRLWWGCISIRKAYRKWPQE